MLINVCNNSSALDDMVSWNLSSHDHKILRSTRVGQAMQQQQQQQQQFQEYVVCLV